MGLESVPCDFCGTSKTQTLFSIQESPDERQPPAWRGTATIPVVRCDTCSLVYLNPRYDNERLTALYQDPQMFIGTIDPEGKSRSIAGERTLRVARFGDEARSLKRQATSGRLLDVGCGLGFFLEAIGLGYDAVGLEWSRPVIDMLKPLPLKVVEDRFPHHPFKDEEFDIVTFHNMLDHLPSPVKALETAHSLLKPAGLLMMTLVNFGGIAAHVYGPGFRMLGPNHLYYFTRETLNQALKRTGFQLEKIEYPYLGTEFAKPLEHGWKVLKDAIAMHVLKISGKRLSPPFYGNLMRVFARKV